MFAFQEEIRFCVSPELMGSMLLFEALDDNEAILIEGFETFSSYDGYGRTLCFGDDFKERLVASYSFSFAVTVLPEGFVP